MNLLKTVTFSLLLGGATTSYSQTLTNELDLIKKGNKEPTTKLYFAKTIEEQARAAIIEYENKIEIAKLENDTATIINSEKHINTLNKVLKIATSPKTVPNKKIKRLYNLFQSNSLDEVMLAMSNSISIMLYGHNGEKSKLKEALKNQDLNKKYNKGKL